MLQPLKCIIGQSRKAALGNRQSRGVLRGIKRHLGCLILIFIFYLIQSLKMKSLFFNHGHWRDEWSPVWSVTHCLPVPRSAQGLGILWRIIDSQSWRDLKIKFSLLAEVLSKKAKVFHFKTFRWSGASWWFLKLGPLPVTSAHCPHTVNTAEAELEVTNMHRTNAVSG